MKISYFFCRLGLQISFQLSVSFLILQLHIIFFCKCCLIVFTGSHNKQNAPSFAFDQVIASMSFLSKLGMYLACSDRDPSVFTMLPYSFLNKDIPLCIPLADTSIHALTIQAHSSKLVLWKLVQRRSMQ